MISTILFVRCVVASHRVSGGIEKCQAGRSTMEKQHGEPAMSEFES